MSSSSTPNEVQRSASAPAPVPTTAVRVQAFAPYKRRKHQKSRTGCRTCKARKIKCDEQRPACCNCILHGVECPFLSPDEQNKTPTSSPLPIPESRDKLSLLELELLHHFTTETFTTLATDAGVQEFWRTGAVHLAFGCEYILDTLLALSALHLAHIQPQKRDFYASQGVSYHQKASALAIQRMANIVDGNDQMNLFLFSILTIYVALGSPRSLDGRLFTSDVVFPEWAFLLGGSKVLNEALARYDEDQSAPLRPLMSYGSKRWHAIFDSETLERSEVLDVLRQRVTAAVQDEDLLRTYIFAIDQLDLSLSHSMTDPSVPRDVYEPMMWLYKVSDKLVPLLKIPVQEAVAIFVHFCLLLKQHEVQWWFEGWSSHIISQAYNVLDEEHKSWIEAPMKEIGWTP